MSLQLSILGNGGRIGGPVYVRLADNVLIDDQGIDRIGGGGGGGGDIAAPPPPIDPSDVSGGSTSSPTAQAAQDIEEFAAEGGGVLAIVYGEHLIAGNLIAHKFTAGTPNVSLIMVALGDGQGNGGGHGEWEAAVAVYYAGEALSVSPNGSTAGYRFHAGYISTGVSDPNQPVDAFLSSGLAYSGSAMIAVKLPDAYANAEDRPDKLRGRYKGRKVYDFDVTGRQVGYAYSVNPARVAADRLLAYYEHKFPTNAGLAMQKLQEKIDWEAWGVWRANCGESISWDNGTSVVSIPRFEAHVAFTDDAILADALDQICATAGAFWQDDGEQIIFLPPLDRAPVHHFNEANIIQGTFQVQPRDLRDRPNYFVCEFRDLDDTYFGLSSTEVRRDSLIKQVGEIKSTRAMPTMHKSQADRLMERQARLEADNPNICTLTGDENSIHLLPGDFVTVSHSITGWVYQPCLVLSVNVSSSEQGADTCEVALQQVNDSLYTDVAQGPRQEALAP